MSRGEGKSAVGLAAYMTGEDMKDERTGKWCTRNHPGEVLGWGTTVPSSAPAYLSDDAQISKAWNAVEKSETRTNSHVANHWNIASSREFSEADHVAVAQAMARAITDRYGVMVTWAIHKPTDHGDDRNWHIHLGYNMRRINADGFAAKAREITAKQTRVEETIWQRKLFAHVINDRLEVIGSDERVSPETYQRQGKDREPTKHLGAEQHQLELQGVATMFGEENRSIRERNAERAKLKLEHAVITAEIIDLETERLKRGKDSRMSDEDDATAEADGGLSKRKRDLEADAMAASDNAEQVTRQVEELDRIKTERDQLASDRVDRAQAIKDFEQKQEQEISEANRSRKSREEREADLERHREPADAYARYASALSASTMSGDVFTVLSAAARAEYAAFAEKQAWYREQEGKATDPIQIALLRTDRHIEWYEYRAITDRKVASYTQVSTRNMDNLHAVATLQEATACEGNAAELRQHRTELTRQMKEGIIEQFHYNLANDAETGRLSAKFEKGHAERQPVQPELHNGTIPADEGEMADRAINRRTQGQYTRDQKLAAKEGPRRPDKGEPETKDDLKGLTSDEIKEIRAIQREERAAGREALSRGAPGQSRGTRGRS